MHTYTIIVQNMQLYIWIMYIMMSNTVDQHPYYIDNRDFFFK